MRNIVILAAGPPKPNRERHTEIINNKIIIDDIIEKCTIDNTKLYIVVNSLNVKLLNHLKSNHGNVNILIPKETMYDTLTTALSVSGDCVLVMGDLINLQDDDIKKFVNTTYSSAICRYKIPWGSDLIGGNYIRRGDIGDAITLISEKDKEYFLSDNNYNKAIYYFKNFYPNRLINYNVQNDIGTHMNYAFFFEIWGNKNINSNNLIGSIYYEHKVYSDND
tara:strand:+ start:634 stop:1296 length:663 start_codon:yes stop_codon:yes gene_type:complete